jgi:predicted TIM-barrel fold metal-dependent hydrolase
MDVIDTQVHLNREIGIEASLFAMNAVGVDAVLIDEWSGFDSRGLPKPYRLLSNGVPRAEYPMAREAVQHYPDRFAITARIHRDDPDLDALMAQVATDPHQLCVRVAIMPKTNDHESLVEGRFDRLFAAAHKHQVPLMVYMPGELDRLASILSRFPGLTVIIDHCGIRPFTPTAGSAGFAFGDAAAVATANRSVYIKISHAPTLSAEGFPFADIRRQIRRLIDTVGADRLMWASDYTQAREHHTWAEALLYLQVPGLLSETEMEWIFGKTAREALSWPNTASFGYFPKRQS